MNNQFTLCYHIAGTLSADLDIRWTAPFDCVIEHISAVSTNDSSAKFKAGVSPGSTYLPESPIGGSGVPAVFGRNHFTGGQFPRIRRGDIVVLALDFDGGGGIAAHDVTLVAFLSKG